MSQTLLHLIYIHGFQGNDTTFQSFPTDLQKHIASNLPNHLKVQSSLYPTYKSVKPISFATRNFLDWLTTQPPGPVIVLGHSMGGLLASDAATDPSNTSRRIIAVVAFDTPYLGMHPHVVVSGIASLFPKSNEEDKEKPTEREMNEEHVRMVDDAVTDDWAAYKKNIPKPGGYTSSTSLTAHPPSPYRAPSPQPASSPSNSQMLFPTYRTEASQLVDHTVSNLMSGPLKFISTHSDDPLVRWVRKHSDAPIAAGKKWIIEHFQFGSCMFDVPELKDRYAKLVRWDGLWVNYWTETIPRDSRHKIGDRVVLKEGEAEAHAARLRNNDIALLETGIADLSPPASPPTNTSSEDMGVTPQPPTLGPPTESKAKAIQKAETKAAERADKAQVKSNKAAEKALKKQREAQIKAEKKGIIPARHFIVLPTGLGRSLGGSEKWERVQIAGVHDEVAAHCGLFIRGQNLDYDGLVEKVGKRVLGWCGNLS